jgi:2-polyprenyl-3-methyl-5-hydroxy-6-metoxy-1,4-benzoquinol methylase
MSATSEAPAVAESDGGCVLCGAQRVVPFFAARGRGDVRPTEPQHYRITHSERRLVYAIVRCVDCGMVTLPREQVPRVVYADAADPYYLEQASERIANARRLLDLLPPGGGQLLELGCACGFLLVAARERGFTVQGIEPSTWAAAHARAAHGLDVKTGSLETVAIPSASCDVAVMADVIEHLADPRQTVRQISRVLRPGGRLLLLTPDIGSPVARLMGPRWWGLLDDHYFYFSRQTLRRLLEAEGFAVERIVGLGRVFRLSHWVSKLAPYNRALHTSVSRVTRGLRLDGLQISINLGDQMACVARKP